jgi:hypothetical protein
MKKEHTYVECQGCKWQIEQNIVPDRDWEKNPCLKCNNTRLVIDPRELLCNMCGETVCPIGTHNEQYPHGLFEAKVTGGYDSYHLLDMNQYTFSFCEKCLRQMFIQCKIKPQVHDMNFGDDFANLTLVEGPEQAWLSDQESYEYRVWLDNGGHHQAYLNKTCNMRKDCTNKAVYTRHINDDFSEECCCEEHKTKDGGSIKHVKFIPNVLKPFL